VGTAVLLIFLAVMVGIAALALLTSVVGPARRLAPPLPVTLGVALGLRLAVMAVAFHHTPYDVALWFRSTGEAVLQHQDPLLVLPRYEWNFLPAMPYVHALELSTGLPWEIAGKLCPLLADLVSTVLVGTLAAPERAARVRWQYAVHPLPLLVVAWHGQIEAPAVALGLAALWAARRGRTGVGGLLLGSDMGRSLRVLGSYRGNTGTWGWTGIQRLAGNVGQGFGGPASTPTSESG
jgi:hypothetical protein